MSASTTEDTEDTDDIDRTCSWCGGDGVDDCDDPIQCMDPDCNGVVCSCRGCDGRGFDQVVW